MAPRPMSAARGHTEASLGGFLGLSHCATACEDALRPQGRLLRPVWGRYLVQCEHSLGSLGACTFALRPVPVRGVPACASHLHLLLILGSGHSCLVTSEPQRHPLK